MSDNPESVTDNSATAVGGQEPSVLNDGTVQSQGSDGVVETPPEPVKTTTDAKSVAGSWKASLSDDLKNSPLIQKFDDTPEGLGKAFESHTNLEKLLGHEKVPIPKDINDVEGWNRFSKAMGIPDKAENYGLPDANIPKEMQGFSIDKNKFAEVVHAHKLTPAQAKGLWNTYQQIEMDTYKKAMTEHQGKITNAANQLRSEWGDTYETNVELGQTVINKFSADQEMNDYLTATLTQDPRGIKFLASIGNQFAENRIGEFQMKKFSLAPEEAMAEIQAITRDKNHAYNSPDASDKEHQAAVDYVNSLYASINRAKG